MGRPINGYGLQRTVFILLGDEEKKEAEEEKRLNFEKEKLKLMLEV